MKNQLDDLRKQIDFIDNQIVDLLAERFIIVKKIGKWKKEKNLPPLDKVRWKKILSKVKKSAEKKGLTGKFIEKIYQLIHKQSLKIEKSL